MSAAERVDRVPEIRRSLTNIMQLCDELGLLKGAKRQAGGLLVCCPSHGEKNASCSVTLGRDGTVRVRCFGCDFAGDALHLIAAARGLDLGRDFPEVLTEAARIGGSSDLLDDAPLLSVKPFNAPTPERVYPLASEVASVWQQSIPVTESAAVASWLVGRGFAPETVAKLDLGRALRPGAHLPRWASYRGDAESPVSWQDTGHRLILPVYDPTGTMRSVRAARVTEGRSPKRLPPAGHRQAGLVLANKAGRSLLGHGGSRELLIVEGEPDFLTWACEVAGGDRAVAVIGIGSGSWTREFASRVPIDVTVVVRTHQDPAGDKYAAEVGRTLVRRAKLYRPAPDGLGDENDRLVSGALAPRYDADALAMVVDSVDPQSFFLGRLFTSYGWLGDELKPGMFAARCPAEALHVDGARFDGNTLVRVLPQHLDGIFRCAHPMCRRLYDSIDVVGNAMRRVAESEGL